MKSLIIAASAVTAVSVAAPALAQDQASAPPSLTSPQGYVNLGYTYLNPYKRDLGEITGRIGVRMGRYWGVEGELGGGVTENKFTSAAGVPSKASEGIQGSGYAVGYLPLPVLGGDKLELLARVGYGVTPVTIKDPFGHVTNSTHNINYGAGAQYMVDAKNGVRFDYTRRDFQESGPFHPQDIDTYSMSYVRKF